MRLRSISLATILILSFVSSAFSGPDIEIPEATFNFGKVMQQKVLTHTFWIKSIGDDTLRLTSIWPGCSCTQIPLADSSIAPGDSLPFTVILNTKRFYGPVTKKPSIYTNVSDDKIEFNVWLDVLIDSSKTGVLDVRPKELDVSQYGEKTRRVAKFHVENRTDQDLTLSITDSTLKSFEVKLPRKLKAGETIEGKLRVRDEMVEKEFEESLTFKVDNLDDATYSVPVRRIYHPTQN